MQKKEYFRFKKTDNQKKNKLKNPSTYTGY